MAKAKPTERPQDCIYRVGDQVSYQGIPVKVIEILDNGHIRCWSPTMQLYVSDAALLEKVRGE